MNVSHCCILALLLTFFVTTTSAANYNVLCSRSSHRCLLSVLPPSPAQAPTPIASTPLSPPGLAPSSTEAPAVLAPGSLGPSSDLPPLITPSQPQASIPPDAFGGTSPPPGATNSPTPGSSKKSSTGAAVGAALGVFAVFSISLGVAAYCKPEWFPCCGGRRRREQQYEHHMTALWLTRHLWRIFKRVYIRIQSCQPECMTCRNLEQSLIRLFQHVIYTDLMRSKFVYLHL